MRDSHAAAGAHQVGGVVSVGGVGGEEGHGRHQARTGHGAAGQGGDRGTEGVRRPVGGTHASEEAASTGTGWFGFCVRRISFSCTIGKFLVVIVFLPVVLVNCIN